jgi:hypothetical protein
MAGGWKDEGLTAAEREKLSKLDVGIKSNLNATSAPSKTDDASKGYSVGSTWEYNNEKWQCADGKVDNAVWVTISDIFYFNTWAELLAAISVTGSTYVNKYATVANANGGPVGGATYTAPAVLANYIVDGGGAVYKVIAQGANYSVTCQPRTITNPIVKSVMVVSGPKPTLPGYYIFTVPPTDGLPAGVALNDIAYFDGMVWAVYQLYVKANTVLVATNETGTTQVTWRKFAGTWMSTADEYVPDGKEYQTSKLWNGKPVFRKCWESTTPNAGSTKTYGTIPVTGKILQTCATLFTNTNNYFTFSLCSWLNSGVTAAGQVQIFVYDGNYGARPVVIWVEYTKA